MKRRYKILIGIAIALSVALNGLIGYNIFRAYSINRENELITRGSMLTLQQLSEYIVKNGEAKITVNEHEITCK